MSQKLNIATRKSALALWQATKTQELLAQNSIASDLYTVVTTGDKMQHTQLASVHLNENAPHHLTTGKGLFIKEVQEALLQNNAQIAVHSMKDLPVDQTPGLCIAALLPRATPNDVLILSPQLLKELSLGKENLSNFSFETIQAKLKNSTLFNSAPIGTTSARRQLLMKQLFSEKLKLEILRGNVDSRLQKVNDNKYCAILLAQAGLERLKLFNSNIMISLPTKNFIPASAQGIIAIECATNNPFAISQLQKLNCKKTCVQAALERMVLYFLEGDCNSAVGAFAEQDNINVIYGKNKSVQTTTIQITESDRKEIESLWQQSKQIYSDFFLKILSSKLGETIYQKAKEMLK